MFIRTQKGGKNGQHEYVYLVEGFTGKNGKTQQHVVKSFGRLDVLEKEDPNILEKLKAQYGGSREEKDQRNAALRAEATQQFLEKVIDFDSGSYPLLKYGHYPVRALWRNFFHLHRKFKYVKDTTHFKFNIDETICFLVASKILHPSSILALYQQQDTYLSNPIAGVPLDSVYDTLQILHEEHDSLMKLVNKAIGKEVPKDRNTLVFYDVTNTYFETSMTDREKGYEDKDFPDILLEMAKQAKESGMLSDECFDNEGDVIPENLPVEFLEKVAEAKVQYLRMRGPSKEHRFDLPLISIALVIDRYGFPMDFQVFSGNKSEYDGMVTSIERFRKKYNIKDAIVVADKGLNSGANLQMLQQHGLGYLMSQKITKLSAELTTQMLDKSLYRPFDESKPELGSYQVIEHWKKGSTVGPIDCSLIFTFNEKRKKRDEAVLELWREIVLAKKEQGVKVKPRMFGWAGLAKINKELKDGSPIEGIDEEVYEKKKALCGYAALIYQGPPPETESEIPVTEDGEIIETQEQTEEEKQSFLPAAKTLASCYGELNQIEACFRIMKTNLGLRPMYVWNSQHVKGHVCVCVLALMLVRLIQYKLEQQGTPMTIHEICRALDEAQVIVRKDAEGKVLVHPTHRGIGTLRKGRERASREELITLVKDFLKMEQPIDKIMRACGLTPLKGTYAKNELQRALGTQFSDDREMVGELVWESMM